MSIKAKARESSGGKLAGRGRPLEKGSSKLTNPIDVREQAAKEAGVRLAGKRRQSKNRSACRTLRPTS